MDHLKHEVAALRAELDELRDDLGLATPKIAMLERALSHLEALMTDQLLSPLEVARQLGWSPVKLKLVAEQLHLRAPQHFTTRLVVQGVGKPPGRELCYTPQGLHLLQAHARAMATEKPVMLTKTETDVLIAAERLGINQGPVLLSGVDLAAMGYPHGGNSMDRTIRALITKGVFRMLPKTHDRRGKLLERTDRTVTKAYSSLHKDLRRQATRHDRKELA